MNIRFTPAGLNACNGFIAYHGGVPHNEEQLEAMASASLSSLIQLLADEKWLTCADVHQFVALGALTSSKEYQKLTLHARRNDDESWTVGIAAEFPVSDEYLRRRRESEAAIIKAIA